MSFNTHLHLTHTNIYSLTLLQNSIAICAVADLFTKMVCTRLLEKARPEYKPIRKFAVHSNLNLSYWLLL